MSLSKTRPTLDQQYVIKAYETLQEALFKLSNLEEFTSGLAYSDEWDEVLEAQADIEELIYMF